MKFISTNTKANKPSNKKKAEKKQLFGIDREKEDDGVFALTCYIHEDYLGQRITAHRVYVPWKDLSDKERATLLQTTELVADDCGDYFTTDQTRGFRPGWFTDQQWQRQLRKNAKMEQADVIDQILQLHFPQLKTIHAGTEDLPAQARMPVPFISYGSGTIKIIVSNAATASATHDQQIGALENGKDCGHMSDEGGELVGNPCTTCPPDKGRYEFCLCDGPLQLVNVVKCYYCEEAATKRVSNRHQKYSHCSWYNRPHCDSCWSDGDSGPLGTNVPFDYTLIHLYTIKLAALMSTLYYGVALVNEYICYIRFTLNIYI
jgi:hypothetical protein